MKLEHWKIVFNAYRQVRARLDQWLPAEGTSGTKRSVAPVGSVGLLQLQGELLEVVSSLQSGLDSAGGIDEVTESVPPFVYLVDELVLRRLADGEQTGWPLLQYRLYGQDAGGDLFFELAEKKLELADRKLLRPGSSALVFEMLHFCLTAGFGGRYMGNETKLGEYKKRLAQHIPTPESVDAPPPAEDAAPPLIHEFPTRYYVVTGFFILLLPVVLWWLSN